MITRPVCGGITSFTVRFYSSKEKGIIFTNCSMFSAGKDKTCRNGLLLSSRRVRRELSICIYGRTFHGLECQLRRRLSTYFNLNCSKCLKMSVVVYQFPSARMRCEVRPYMRIGLQVGVKIMTRLVRGGCVTSKAAKHFSVACRPISNRTLRVRRRVGTTFPLRVGSKGIISNCVKLAPIAGGDICQT